MESIRTFLSTIRLVNPDVVRVKHLANDIQIDILERVLKDPTIKFPNYKQLILTRPEADSANQTGFDTNADLYFETFFQSCQAIRIFRKMKYRNGYMKANLAACKYCPKMIEGILNLRYWKCTEDCKYIHEIVEDPRLALKGVLGSFLLKKSLRLNITWRQNYEEKRILIQEWIITVSKFAEAKWKSIPDFAPAIKGAADPLGDEMDENLEKLQREDIAAKFGVSSDGN